MSFKKYTIIYYLLLQSIVFSDNVNVQYPNIYFDFFNGERKSIEDLTNNGPLVIQFWAIWCSPCKKEMFYLNKIRNKYKNLGMEIICVNTDNSRLITKAKSFLKQKKYGFLVASDPNSELFKRLSASVMPTTLIFDKNNEIVFKKEGFMPGDEKIIEQKLKTLIEGS